MGDHQGGKGEGEREISRDKERERVKRASERVKKEEKRGK